MSCTRSLQLLKQKRFGILAVEPFDPVAASLMFQMLFPAKVFQVPVFDPVVGNFSNDCIGAFDACDVIEHGQADCDGRES